MSSDFHERLAEVRAEVETMLDSILTTRPAPGEAARPERLVAAMRHATLNGGKRLRPFLVIETAALFGASGPGVMRAAAALECVHCYSLVHDDLPAMDDDDLRRGKSTVHRAFDEATAILAGDALLTLAFALLADPATHRDGHIRAELVADLAAAAGVGGMAGGQMVDLASEHGNLSERDIRSLLAMKTGALFRHACHAGAILGGADEADRIRLTGYGDHLGLAFQVADDLLDATGSAEVAGKRTAKDAKRGKATLVALHGVDGARGILDIAVTEAVAALEPYGERAAILAAAARSLAT